MIRPINLEDDAWKMFNACRPGDLDRVKALGSQRPDLLLFEYNYTPPVHFAVREGHLDVVHFLVEQGGADLAYRSYPFQDRAGS